jgi:hypothetical protein
MINKIAYLNNIFTNIKNIFVDAANPELISSLKREVAYERDNWSFVQEKMEYCNKHHVDMDINRHMKVVPVPFPRGQEHAHSYKRTSRIRDFDSH